MNNRDLAERLLPIVTINRTSTAKAMDNLNALITDDERLTLS